jgi:tRNA pseudouridine38-40 synthase
VRTLKLVLAYDGTDYSGWQRQARGSSIQGLLEDALTRIEGGPVAVVGAGRTDAGVHATGQVASAVVTFELDAPTLRRALNQVLPPAIRILHVDDCEPGFHARFSASRKTYEYRVLNGPLVSPFWRQYVWHVPGRLNAGAMVEAARLLEGTHDFAAFRSAGTDVHTTTRTLTESSIRVSSVSIPAAPLRGVPDIREGEGALITYVITGNGFLRHMVRAIAGTLVEVGAGRIPVAAIPLLLREGRRDAAGPTAPPWGLCLAAVEYDHGSPAVATHR